MGQNIKRADAELLAQQCRELEELARYSGFEFGAYLLSISHAEFVEQGQKIAQAALEQRRTSS